MNSMRLIRMHPWSRSQDKHNTAFIFIEMTTQRVFYTIDSYASQEQELICRCKLEGMQVCNCEPGNCTCNSVKFDTIYIDLPTYFAQSPNTRKSVSILQARLFDVVSDTEITGSLHSSLVQTDSSSDNYVCSTNKLYPIPPTFCVPTRQMRFECWCRDIHNKLIDLDTKKAHLLLELLLEF